MSVSKLGELSL